MNNTSDIKKRLSSIQGNFNPEKSTYKVIDYVVNTELSSFEMLMELSKIRGVSKYPDDVKKEYISIVNDLKEIIVAERKAEHKKKQEESTRQLKDLIARLEKRKDLQSEKLKSVVDENDSSVEVLDEKPKDNLTDDKDSTSDDIQSNSDASITDNEDKNNDSDIEDSKSKVNLYLIIGLFVAIVINILIFLFY